MKTQTARKSLYPVLMIILMFVQSSCAGAAQADPTEAPVVSPPTSTQTSLPSPTSTVTLTSLPTMTFTPVGTPTEIPELTPAAEGRGNIVGLVLWNNQPVPKAAVWLCEKFENSCEGHYTDRVNTDKNGYYVFDNVPAGKYMIAMNSFSSSWFIFYFDAAGDREQGIAAGQDLVLDPWNIWKFDLKTITPTMGKVSSEPTMEFTWNPYPDAAYYQISLYDENFNTVLESERVDGTAFTPQETLKTCKYSWAVEAYTDKGIKLSQNIPAPYSTLLSFRLIDLPTTC